MEECYMFQAGLLTQGVGKLLGEFGKKWKVDRGLGIHKLLFDCKIVKEF